jgi:hypothetical protein
MNQNAQATKPQEKKFENHLWIGGMIGDLNL